MPDETLAGVLRLMAGVGQVIAELTGGEDAYRDDYRDGLTEMANVVRAAIRGNGPDAAEASARLDDIAARFEERGGRV